MQRCSHCNGPLQDDIEVCTFCNTLTARGVEAKRVRQQASEAQAQANQHLAAAQAQATRTRAQSEVEQAGKFALIASLVGGVLCCVLPIGPVLGVLSGLKARRLAKEHGIIATTQATAGLWVGVIMLVLSVATWAGIAVLGVQEANRKTELQAMAEPGITSANLDTKTACALTELELIETHFQKYYAHDGFHCLEEAELTTAPTGDAATLTGPFFKKENKKNQVVGCLVRKNGRWAVKQLRDDDDCSAAPVSAPEG